MRKLSYLLTFLAVSITLVLNIISRTRTDWLVAQPPEILYTNITITYGLSHRCERSITRIPGPSRGRLEYSDYECRGFPLKVTDRCEKENAGFCNGWTSAKYLIECAFWSAIASLCAIAFGVTTHSRRRRIWRVAAGLISLHAISQLAAFSIVTDLFRTSHFPTFEYAHFGSAYIMNTVSWIFGVFIVIGVVATGISADMGRKWAAGNRAYAPIPGP